MAESPAEPAWAGDILKREARALMVLADSLGEPFVHALDVLGACADAGGSVLVSGLGKSGLVGAKISATMASLGIPSHSVHPSEAAHGDLGRFRPSDAAICLSYSGETEEVVNLAAILRQDGIPVVSMTRGPGPDGRPPTLDALASVALPLGQFEEAGAPDFVAPTSSTTAMMALGDALALCLARRRNFTQKDFAKRHPGGSLGSTLRPVTDILRFRVGVNVPLIDEGTPVAEALRSASALTPRRPGAMLVVDDRGRLAGIFTDGDLRRLILRGPSELAKPIREVMTRSPRTLPDSSTVKQAVLLVREHRQDELPVVDSQGRPVGIVDVQDLITLRLVSDEGSL